MVDRWEAPGREGAPGGLPRGNPPESLRSGVIVPDSEGRIEGGVAGAPHYTHERQGPAPRHRPVLPGTEPDDFPWDETRNEGITAGIIAVLSELAEYLAADRSQITRDTAASQLTTIRVTVGPFASEIKQILGYDPDRRRVSLSPSDDVLIAPSAAELPSNGFKIMGGRITLSTTAPIWVCTQTTDATPQTLYALVERGEVRNVPRDGRLASGIDTDKQERSSRAAWAREYPAARHLREWQKT